MTKEEKFYNALKDIFVGAKVEGESGYINLMRIKSRYYEKGVFPKLQEDIAKAIEPFPEFKEELFDKLYTLFQRYFSESGSIYFRYTPIHQNVYEKVYTDDKDVILFWKTHMLYYVKTDRLFKNLEVEVDGHKFFFDVSTLEHKKANEKREIIFEFKEKRKDECVFNVFYSERGKKTKIDDILRSLKKENVEITEDILTRAFRIFEKQSEVDYFINKNAKEFLREQFNIWLYQYVFSGESEWTEKRIKQLQVLKDIAFKIIDFISQFEDELVKIWNKPKFVLNSNYVITLDRIAEKDRELKLIEKILNHGNFETQVKEWKELGIVDDSFRRSKIIENDLTGKHLSKEYKYLPVDTRYFKNLELEILELFDDLDNSLDGWLIKSENYQALNTILPKFKEKVQTIYIDPPYNTGSDEFIYKDKFQHASWLTMIENRLKLAKELMKSDGVIFVSIDDNEQVYLKILLELTFGPSNVLKTVPVIMNLKGNQDEFGFAGTHEYVQIAMKEKDLVRFGEFSIDEEIIDEWQMDEYGFYKIGANLKATGRNAPREKRPNLFFPIYVTPGGEINLERRSPDDIELLPITDGKEMSWRWSKEKIQREKHNLIVIRGGDIINIYKKQRPKIGDLPTKKPKSVLYKPEYSSGNGTNQLKHLFGDRVYTDPKPIDLIADYCIIGGNLNSIVLDFFAGSGTTAHAVMKLNQKDGGRRKFILIEMADYFDTVIIPRIKKVAYSFNWKDGKPQDSDGIGIFFKYYELEQYEDTLRRVKYEDADLFDSPYEDPYNQYVFMKDLKMLEALEVDYENNKVKVDLSRLYSNVDVPETLSNLLGKWIKRITPEYVEFEDGERVDLKNLDYKLIKPLIWW